MCQLGSNKFAIYLQYLKKEVRDVVHFLHADQHQSFYKLALSLLMKVARHVQSAQNRKLLRCWQYRKKCFNYFCVPLWCKTFRYFTGGPVLCGVMFLWGFSHVLVVSKTYIGHMTKWMMSPMAIIASGTLLV